MCIYGISYSSEGILVYDPSIEHFFISRDIIFHEDVFPFQEELSYNQQKHMVTDHRPFFIEEDILPRQPMVIPHVSSPMTSPVLAYDVASPSGTHNSSDIPLEVTSRFTITPQSPTSSVYLSSELPETFPSTTITPPRRSHHATQSPTWTADYICPTLE